MADLPTTTALDLRRSSRVSIDTEPLYLPLVWHSAQRDLMIGTMSCAKSTGFASRAAQGSTARATASRQWACAIGTGQLLARLPLGRGNADRYRLAGPRGNRVGVCPLRQEGRQPRIDTDRHG